MSEAVGKKELGYNKQLLILPFDHRGSFQSKMFGITGTPTPEQTALIASYKTVIYDGFEKAVQSGLPREMMGILVDEQFGGEVIQRAKAGGFTVCICCEKSGQNEFDFEYGKDYPAHIEKWDPDFVKVLVRLNPEDDAELNRRQVLRLAELSQYLGKKGRKFIFELLVPATPEQLTKCKDDTEVFDREIRPALTVKAIQMLHAAGVEPDVWKLEGMERDTDYKMVCDATRVGGRDKVGTIILGRGANAEKVRHWLKEGANVSGVIGFAVGRTTFWEPLKALKAGTITKAQAADQVAEIYGDFCRYWLDARA